MHGRFLEVQGRRPRILSHTKAQLNFSCEISPFEKGHGLPEGIQGSLVVPALLNDTEMQPFPELWIRLSVDRPARWRSILWRILKKGCCVNGGEGEGEGRCSDLGKGAALIELKRACVMNHNILTYLVNVLIV
jgi:hypothetical protein